MTSAVRYSVLARARLDSPAHPGKAAPGCPRGPVDVGRVDEFAAVRTRRNETRTLIELLGKLTAHSVHFDARHRA
ncbi:hypothetical protein ACFXKC_47110 [Streptomyces sp. NPDC059340]|uniref:hypothetical protein n=1 Tax=Streptomyces sp. NPDC059340 TaxID=3346806 RepID=UPI0036C043AE